MRLKNKSIIVTGAASGIGLKIAETFAEEGAHVCMADINMSGCKEASANINRKFEDRTYPLSCDIRSMEDVARMVKSVTTRSGTVDVLINNAAVAIGGNILDMAEHDWNTVIDVNLSGAYRCIQKVLPFMIDKKYGSIINMSSTQAHRSWHNWTAYAAAKGGLLSMTTQLAGQFAPYNIRVNSISPGTINTPMLDQRMQTEGRELKDRFVEMHAMDRLGTPEEAASVALFLASDESAFVTGVDIKVDGGLSTLPRYREL